ncbi:hypothetical protein, partial [Pseudomonas cichorii]|uniref:hypothetical protein n=1 Tax=Pseudomonas cichorii TaxID=36746 RepID=UPI001C814108
VYRHRVETSGYLLLNNTGHGSEEMDVPQGFSVVLGFAVEVQRWQASISVDIKRSGLMKGVMAAPIASGLAVGDWVVCSRATLLKGHLVVVPSGCFVSLMSQ